MPAKYPGKRSYRGENKGKLSGNPRGKNPEDVWDIPNVKGNHVEKTEHPCQFPVGLIERLVLSMTNEGDLVFDPFCNTIDYCAIVDNNEKLKTTKDAAESKLKEVNEALSNKQNALESKRRLLNDEELGAKHVNEYLNDYFGHHFVTLEARWPRR